MQTVISKELVCAVHDVVGDQSVKTDQELCAQVVLDIVHMPQTEKLVALRIIPRR